MWEEIKLIQFRFRDEVMAQMKHGQVVIVFCQMCKILDPQVDTEEYTSFLKRRSSATSKEADSVLAAVTTAPKLVPSLKSDKWLAIREVFLAHSKKGSTFLHLGCRTWTGLTSWLKGKPFTLR